MNLNVMQSKIDKLLSVFTKLIKELETQISSLNFEIVCNKERIEKLEADNVTYESKIKEYTTLKENVERIIK